MDTHVVPQGAVPPSSDRRAPRARQVGRALPRTAASLVGPASLPRLRRPPPVRTVASRALAQGPFAA